MVSDILPERMSETPCDDLKKDSAYHRRADESVTGSTTSRRWTTITACPSGQPPGDDLLEGDFWKQFFIKRLPANIHPLPVSSLDILAEMVGLILHPTRMAEVQEDPAHQASASHETSSVVDDLQKQVQNHTLMVESFASSVKKTRKLYLWPSTRTGRSRSRQGRRTGPGDICMYHQRFGADAYLCRQPCIFFKTRETAALGSSGDFC